MMNCTLSTETMCSSPLLGVLTLYSFGVFLAVAGAAEVLFGELGIITNIFNVRTFISMGIYDGVSVSFFCLSCVDLILSGATVGHGVAAVLLALRRLIDLQFYYDPDIPGVFCFHIGSVLIVLNTLITVYLAVARCFCVAKPLQFKSLFNKRRTMYFIAVFSLFATVVFIPEMVVSRGGVVFLPSLNRTEIRLKFAPERKYFKNITYVFSTAVFPVVSQLVLVICIQNLAWNLRKAVQFRQSATVQKVLYKEEMQITPSTSKSSISGKEVQAVRQVVYISIIFIICSIPTNITSLAAFFEPEFNNSRGNERFYYLYTAAYSVCRVTSQINSSVNMFIYLKYNTKYRESFKNMLIPQ